MFKNRTTKTLLIVIVVLFSITFYFGIFANPNFNIYDFCMNLSTEIVGLVIALALVDSYITAKKKSSEEKQFEPAPAKFEKNQTERAEHDEV